MLTTTDPRRAAIGALAVALLVAACGNSADSGDTDSNGASTDPSGDGSAAAQTSTLAGVEAAQWSDTITLTIEDGSFRFESNGIPDHELPDQFLVPTTGEFGPPVSAEEVQAVDSEIAVVESPVDQTITLDPVYSETVTETSLGTIGVTISGAPIFNDYEDMSREYPALDDNITIGGVDFVDACSGHPLALLADGTGQGGYHYHGIPYCITDTVDVAGEHSTIIGVLLDGFPLYGNKDEDGAAITSDDLDECSGHVGPTPEFPEGIYHYHLTEDRAPYSVDCYHGEVDASAQGEGGPGGGPDGGPPPGADAAPPTGGAGA